MPRIDQRHAESPPGPKPDVLDSSKPGEVLDYLAKRYFALRKEIGKRAGVKDAREYLTDGIQSAIGALADTLEALHRSEARPTSDEDE